MEEVGTWIEKEPLLLPPDVRYGTCVICFTAFVDVDVVVVDVVVVDDVEAVLDSRKVVSVGVPVLP